MSKPMKLKKKPRFWTKEEDLFLRAAIKKYGTDSYESWKEIALNVPDRSYRECMQRWTKVLCPGLKKGKWGTEEDAELTRLVKEQLKSLGKDANKKIIWSKITKEFNGRSCKQCRERWINHLDPNVRKGEWTPEEDQKLLLLAEKDPNKWAKIGRQLPGRTENMVKVRWNALNRQIQKHKANTARLNNQMKQQAAMYGAASAAAAAGLPMSPRAPNLMGHNLNDFNLLSQQEQVRRASVLSFGSLLESNFLAGNGARRGSFTSMIPLVQTPTDRKNSFLINTLWQDAANGTNGDLDGNIFERERRLSRRLSQIALNLYDPNSVNNLNHHLEATNTDTKTEEKNCITAPRNGGFYLNEIESRGRRKSSLLLNELLKSTMTSKTTPTLPVHQEQPKPQLSFGRFNEKNQNLDAQRRLSTMLFQNLHQNAFSPSASASGANKRNDLCLFEEDNKRGRKDSLMLFQNGTGKKLKPSSYHQQLPTMAESPAEAYHEAPNVIGERAKRIRRLSAKLEQTHLMNNGITVAK
mmetsp:Transcript_9270/g.10731  ORF Transcript_9270/g.10731 Transcript_9270/m.10731 type:complete len:524 (+) Transcript_9270:224-1795(+)|eukprot:CAMPEP_0204841954 /NCGR_PEP_ID=MMETSP1346-20131115/44324_1 /ASSEMBLY_ACC=CAM_ASM_000771 /TAXON_ID=215587 /ORGANISM="Aplanochytrium stocchinoi, Strain GSBS06" /LENGTH=523 /DNA_ID=CAMNT_0051980465 /DNA_START=222 /DNA_END=1793 /DNA_ORIENTATION=+